MNSKKFVMSFSGGKDSTLALYKMIKEGHKPVALLTTIKEDKDESWTHSIKYKYLKIIENSLNIPIIISKCGISDYETNFEKNLIKAKQMGATHCVFGDIDIDLHRNWNETRCENAGLEAILPLWQRNREEVLYEFLDSGFTTVITKVNLNNLGVEFLGKVLDKPLAKEIEKQGSDICGENGEYHTFVVDGPLFSSKIEFENTYIEQKDGYGHLVIE